MASSCFYKTKKSEAKPIVLVKYERFDEWKNEHASDVEKNQLAVVNVKPGSMIQLFDEKGCFNRALATVDASSMWAIADVNRKLPSDLYVLDDVYDELESQLLYLGFALGCYEFNAYRSKVKNKKISKLYLSKSFADVEKIVKGVYLTRDMINTPSQDMGPEEIAKQAQKLAQTFSAHFNQIVGDELITHNYPGIHAVGRASDRLPRLVEVNWGKKTDPHVILVGKGVAFDTGGLDIKPASGMLLMHKDMGGAAQVLGLARIIMDMQLPIQLSVLIPAVENAINGNAYRPSDVITMRNGTTVEITNTDAEGRVVLADALVEASSRKPEMIIDFATLTGAARVAVGTEISAYFSNNEAFSCQLETTAESMQDPVWRMPLFTSYEKLLDSRVADMKNAAAVPYAGSITAALFLQKFIGENIEWAHFDVMAWNTSVRSGCPIGGEAMGIRAVYELLSARFKLS